MLRWIGQDPQLESQVRDHAHALGLPFATGPGPAAALVLDPAALKAADAPARSCEHGPHPPASADPVLLVVTREGEDDAVLLHRALDRGARAVLSLPRDSARLLELCTALTRPVGRARLIGVVGAVGGAGTSSFAARLAAAARRTGDTLLVDADPWGCGIELIVDSPADGFCWADLDPASPPEPAALHASLPRVDEVGLLGPGRGDPPTGQAIVTALTVLAHGTGAVVVDLAAPLVPEALGLLDRLVLLVPSHEQAVHAAARRLDLWQVPDEQLALVVRRTGPLTPADVGTDLGLPVAGAFRDHWGSTVPLLDVRRGGADACARGLFQAVGA